MTFSAHRSWFVSPLHAALPAALASAAISALSAIGAAGCLAPDAVAAGEGGSGAGAGSGTSTSTGGGPPGSYELAWARAYGLDSDSDQHVLGVAATEDGGALVAGEHEGSLTIGSTPTIPNSEPMDGFVALFDPAGEPIWSAGFTGAGNQRVYKALPAPGGGFVVAGTFAQTLMFGGVDLAPTPEEQDGFVALLADDLSVTWLSRVGGPGNQAVHSIALVPDAGGGFGVLVGGTFENTLSVGGTTTSDSAEGRDFFVAKLDGAGDTTWATSLGGDPVDGSPSEPDCLVAASDDGRALVAGTFTGTVTLGQNLGSVGASDIFVGALDPDGQPVWAHTIGAPDSDNRAASIALAPDGSSALAGDVRGEAHFDASPLLQSHGTEYTDALLVVFEPDGSLSWARPYGSEAEDHGSSIAVAPAGDLLFTGTFRGALTFGEEDPLLHSSAIAYDDDIFLARLSPTGQPLFAAKFGENHDQTPTFVAATPGDDILLGGWFFGAVDFGSGEIDAGTGDDLFVIKLSPASN